MAVTTVNIIARVYIFIDTRRICRTLFFDIVGFVAKGLNRKLTSRCGYKYILNRWARIVFDIVLRPTPFSRHIHARMDIGARGYLYSTAYGVPPPTHLYYIVLPSDNYLYITRRPSPPYGLTVYEGTQAALCRCWVL